MTSVHTAAHWFGPHDRPLLGWLTTPPTTSSGCVILPPLGYEYFTSHRTLRTLAEQLALAGHSVLRIDYDGTGDSAGDQWDEERVTAWRAGLAHAANALRGLGAETITVVGLRFGATVALIDAHEIAADAVVAWAPAEAGRRYVKELKLLGTPVPDVDDAIVIAGLVFSGATLRDLAALDVTKIDAPPAPRVLVVERPDRPVNDATIDRIESVGATVDRLTLPGSDLALDLPTEYATVPTEIVDAIAAWVGTAPTEDGHDVDHEVSSAVITRGEAAVEERFVRLGPNELAGIITTPKPAPSTAGHATVVFLNTGSETHIGPGRAWVEYARSLSAMGHTSLRVDFRGWGESPDDDKAPGRSYDAHTVADAVDIVEQLARDGHERIVLAGLCASAWVALKAMLSAPVAGVIAINPQMYWQPGDPVEATMAETRKRRTRDRERDATGRRLWSVLDALGVRHPAATWLRAVGRQQVPVLMLFAEGDDGLDFLRDRAGRSLQHVLQSAPIEVVEVPGIDHPMHRHWLRGEIVAAISGFLDRL